MQRANLQHSLFKHFNTKHLFAGVGLSKKQNHLEVFN